MKYRVINTDDELLPFMVQKMNENSFFPRWKKVTSCKMPHEAEGLIRRTVERQAQYKKGQVIFEYTEADLVIDKLKNEKRRSLESVGVVMAESQDTAGMVQNSLQRAR